jgi:hypothetical protein
MMQKMIKRRLLQSESTLRETLVWLGLLWAGSILFLYIFFWVYFHFFPFPAFEG